MNRVKLGMSGGVDSAVAALLLRRAGFEVDCVTMLLAPDSSEYSRSVIAARSIAEELGCSFEVLDVREEFKRNIIDNFIAEYESGRTPNPCTLCNPEIKFRYLDDGKSLIATGHYARIVRLENGRSAIRKAANPDKDQSYFLYGLSQGVLSRVLFPLGDYGKDEVRRIAEDNAFANAEAKDSQDICFVTGGDYAGFIRSYCDEYGRALSGTAAGNFVDIEGNIIGTHRGIINYTIGQRKGLGVSFGRPLYVHSVRRCYNEIVLAEDACMYNDELTARNFNWMSVEGLSHGEELRCSAKIRYRHKGAECTVRAEGDCVKIKFDSPQRAITAGQSVVLYDEDTVIGGGTICDSP